MNQNYQEIGSVCMGLHIRRAARRITKIYDDALAPTGLTIGQFSLLTTLAAADDWTMQSLADALGTDRTSLTASLKPLERKKLVRSVSHAADKRIRQLAITSDGLGVVDNAVRHWQSAQAQIEDRLGQDDALAIRTSFAKLA